VSKKLKVERLLHWVAKLRIVQLKIKCPSLKQSILVAFDSHNLYKFCTNILTAHSSGAFGGCPALWYFLRDVAINLNSRRKDYRYSENSKAFVQAIKVYEARRTCDLFALNYSGPSYNTMKKENKKGIQHVSDEHREFLVTIVDIYKDALGTQRGCESVERRDSRKR